MNAGYDLVMSCGNCFIPPAQPITENFSNERCTGFSRPCNCHSSRLHLKRLAGIVPARAALPMKKIAVILLSTALLGLSLPVKAQAPAPAASPTPVSSLNAAPTVDLTPSLNQLQQTAGTISLNLSRLRIEKWKADGSVKRQSQADADSITRNLTSAMPSLIDQGRANPQSLAAAVKLYRNVNALYDVFSGLAGMAEAFGPKGESAALAADADSLDRIRRDIGDKLEKLAAGADSEILRLRAEVASKPAPPPTRIIIDDEEKPPKPVRKKPAPAKKPVESKPADNTSPSPAVTK